MSFDPSQNLSSHLLAPIMAGPARVQRGWGILADPEIQDWIEQTLGSQMGVIGGEGSLARLRGQWLGGELWIPFGHHCSEAERDDLLLTCRQSRVTGLLGVGGGKALDMAKLVAFELGIPIITIPTSAATCAAWSPLSNLYSPEGAFVRDVTLQRSPDGLILDYGLLQDAPGRLLRAGIGDALAKWYEASISSRHTEDVVVIAAVQQARVLRDLLFQKAVAALQDPGSLVWQQVVDASICLAGVVGGLGGAQCRTVAAHAVHNGLTHLLQHRSTLHGEKVAYGILVQQRLEEILQGSQLAATARKQLVSFYRQIGLPVTLSDLGLSDLTSAELMRVAQVACAPTSDLHHLPFAVSPEALIVAMQTTHLSSEGSEVAALTLG